MLGGRGGCLSDTGERVLEPVGGVEDGLGVADRVGVELRWSDARQCVACATQLADTVEQRLDRGDRRSVLGGRSTPPLVGCGRCQRRSGGASRTGLGGLVVTAVL